MELQAIKIKRKKKKEKINVTKEQAKGYKFFCLFFLAPDKTLDAIDRSYHK